MVQYIDILKNIIPTYWGNAIMHYIFMIALLVVFFNERDIKKKRIAFWLPVIIYYTLVSPVGIVFGRMFLSADFVAYMCRVISFVPIFYVIAHACVLLTDKFSGIKKPLCVIGVCLSIVLCGAKLIYINDGYQFEKSENVYKIPTDLMTICDYMDSVDEDPVVALNTGYSYMARQYDPSLHLLVGARAEGMKLSDELEKDEPDVPYIMQTSCAWSGDFVIVNNTDSIRGAFSDCGYMPCFETPKLLLYEVGGYQGERVTYNKINQVERREYYDETGSLRETSDGIAVVEYKYDELGRVVEEHYYGKSGSAILNARGFSGLMNTYGEAGTIDRIDYLDQDGKLIIMKEVGYASVSYVRDERGNAIEECYFDAEGKPIELESGYAGIRREFDEYNRVTLLTYLDKSAQKIEKEDGVASISYDYENELGTLELYYDENGKPVTNENGSYGMILRNGANGVAAYKLYTNQLGQPMKNGEGYSKITYMYDRSNRLIRVMMFDEDDNPTICKNGYAGYRRSYSEDGKFTDTYFGIDAKVVESKNPSLQ